MMSFKSKMTSIRARYHEMMQSLIARIEASTARIDKNTDEILDRKRRR